MNIDKIKEKVRRKEYGYSSHADTERQYKTKKIDVTLEKG